MAKGGSNGCVTIQIKVFEWHFHVVLFVFSCLQIHKSEIPISNSSNTDDDLTGKLFNPKISVGP